jgi:stage V sporulation protein G
LFLRHTVSPPETGGNPHNHEGDDAALGGRRVYTCRGADMDVTEVRIFPVQEERLRAYVTITFDHCFVVRDLKVINGNNGLFVAMPSKKRKDGTYRDTAHPLDNKTREMIESKVLSEYNKEIEKSKEVH